MGLELNLRPDTRPRRAKLSIEQFYLISESGAFDDYAKTELLDGEIHVVNSQFMPHMRIKRTILFALQESLLATGSQLEMGVEGAVELGLDNVPEPDVFIFDGRNAVRGVPDGDVKLIVEVADSSERRDLGKKLKIYARNRVPEYWVAVLRTKRIERFTEPSDGGYARHDSFAFGDRVDSLTLPDIHLAAGWSRD